MKAQIGRAVRKRRIELGMTQTALARFTDSTPGNINRLEHERHEPRVGLLMRICAALRISMDELCGMGSGDEAR
jgi:transcriptional regulator with XRE-family HTH domain